MTRLEAALAQYNKEVKMIGYSIHGFPLLRVGNRNLLIEDEETQIYLDVEVKELVKKKELILL